MARRTHASWLPLAVLLCVAAGCKGKAATGTTDLGAKCDEIGKYCADKDKHVGKIAEECKTEAKAQAEKGCAAKVAALFDCYENDVCGVDDKVWALNDVRVLATRKKKCAAEQTALDACMGKK